MADSIWFAKPAVEDLNSQRTDTLSGTLGIEYTQIGKDFVKGTMPVNNVTRQPYGILHGGASVSLAESLGSIGAYLTVDPAKNMVVGLDINANHIKAVREGLVTGTARPLHLGRRTQVWEIIITNDKQQLVCVSRLTIAVLQQSVTDAL